MDENHEENKGKCVADRNFPADIYLPRREIVYDDALNEQILEILRRNPVQYGNVLVNGQTKKHAGFRYLYDYVMKCTEHMPESSFRLAFRLFWVLNRWQDFPKCRNPNCGCRLVLDNSHKAFRLTLDENGELIYKWPLYCSPEHAQMDPDVRRKFVSTCMDRYGCVNVFQVPEIKEKADASRLKSTGVLIPAKSKAVLKRMQDTCLKNYGAANPFQVKQFIEKGRASYRLKTGYDSPSQNPEVKMRLKAKQMSENGYTHIQMRNKAPGYNKNILKSEYDEPLFSLEEFVKTDNHSVPMKFRCKKCGKVFEAIHVRTHNRCPVCYPEDQMDGIPPYLSKLNRRMFRVLDEMRVNYVSEFIVKFNQQDALHTYRRYDVKIGNVLMELNGDYWHARPGFVYRGEPITAETVLLYHDGIRRTAREIWDYDREKADLAVSNGYNFITLWESEMNDMSDDSLKSWIKEKCGLTF